MAPTKKKRKPGILNRDRGFATTSTPAKSKITGTVASVANEAINTNENNTADNFEGSDDSPVVELVNDPQNLDSVSIVQQLEESKIQHLVEKHSEKSKRDGFRQADRLTTERRVLRAQSRKLNFRRRLPDDCVELILETLKSYSGKQSLFQDFENRQNTKVTSEEDLLIRLWKVEITLTQLGFSIDQTRAALMALIDKMQYLESLSLYVGKDMIWGLDECLSHIVLNNDLLNLPKYETEQTKAQSRRKENDQHHQKVTVMNGPQTLPFKAQTKTDQSVLAPLYTGDVNFSQLDDEREDDMDPKDLMEKYLSLQSQLFKFDSNVFGKKEPAKSNDVASWTTGQADSQVTMLLQRINRIESDILFDKAEAHFRWMDLRHQLTKEALERRKLNLEIDKPRLSPSHSSQPLPRSASTIEFSGEDEPLNSLEDLFRNSGSTQLNAEPSDNIRPGSTNETIKQRDFGKWAGVNPRQILEEACRARYNSRYDHLCHELTSETIRDSASKIAYKLISQSTFSNRHSLKIEWSLSQDLPPAPPDPFVNFDATEFNLEYRMESISTPNALQSEAYISTVALFSIFASKPREERVCHRLPPIWRDLWSEMSNRRGSKAEAADRSSLKIIQSLMSESHNKTGCPDPSSQIMPIAQTQKANKLHLPRPGPNTSGAGLEENTMETWLWKTSTSTYKAMLNSRMGLPIWKYKSEILKAIHNNKVTIVCGETGCGKSTQLPAFILESELLSNRNCKIYCAEPRRISAVSLARRVSEELGESKMDVGTSKSLVGYTIRLESRITPQTKLVYATTGILIRMLEQSDDLGDVSHLILDEVHERSIECDFLLIVLRKLIVRRPSLKVILMSATVNAEKFAAYFDGAPILSVPGRTFTVEAKYLEDVLELISVDGHKTVKETSEVEDSADDAEVPLKNDRRHSFEFSEGYSVKARQTLAALDEFKINYDIITRLLEAIATQDDYISYSRAILVFLPGIAEIRRLNSMILGHPTFSEGWNVHPLHSSITTDEQEKAFLIPTRGRRKIVLATNIAETGITIPDVTCVIDTGKHREMRFDEKRRLSRLVETFISRANAKQRRGRAGRVATGLCFHLFTKARHDQLFFEEQTPEMLRLSLQDLVLRVKTCRLGYIEEVLSEALDPPSSKNIQRAIDALVDVKALTAGEDLTTLGRQLAQLPLDVFLGKLLLLGAIYLCLDKALTIAAIMSSKSIFITNLERRSIVDRSRINFNKGNSDLLTTYNAYCIWRQMAISSGRPEQQFCYKNGLNEHSLSDIEDLKARLTTILVEAGFVDLNDIERKSLTMARSLLTQSFVRLPKRYNVNNSNDVISNSVVAWAFYPKLLHRTGNEWKNILKKQVVSLIPTSVNKRIGESVRWLSYDHIVQTNTKSFNAHETSAVDELAIVIGCGDAEFKMYSGVISIDGGRLRFSVDNWKALLAIRILRFKLRDIMNHAIRKPRAQLSPEQQVWLDLFAKIFAPLPDDE